SGQLGKHRAGPFRGSESHDGMEPSGGLRTRELDRIAAVISKTGACARVTRESIADARTQRMTKDARRSFRFPSLFEVRKPNPITINIPSEHTRQRRRTPLQVFPATQGWFFSPSVSQTVVNKPMRIRKKRD